MTSPELNNSVVFDEKPLPKDDSPTGRAVFLRGKFGGIVPTLALAVTVESGCVSHHKVGNNMDLVEDGFAARQCEAKTEQGQISYYRFGEKENLPACDDPIKILAIPGVNSRGTTWALLAHSLPPKLQKDFAAVDLPGQGGTDTFGLGTKDTNPVTVASHLRDFVVKIFDNQENTILMGHSTGGAIGAVLLKDLPKTQGIFINPILTMQAESVRSPSRSAPYMCNAEITSHVVREGAVAKMSKGKRNGPGLLELKEKEVQDMAAETNVCLTIQNDKGEEIGEACDHTPVRTLAIDMKENCGTMKGLALSVRNENFLRKWRDLAIDALRNNQARISVFLEESDSVLNSQDTRQTISQNYPQIRIENMDTGGAHEIITTNPKAIAELVKEYISSHSKDKPVKVKSKRKSYPVNGVPVAAN